MKERQAISPPYHYLMQVTNHAPKAASTYISLWNAKNKENKINISKEEIKSSFLITPTKFKNDLLQLVREGLCSIDESPNNITIEMVDWQDE